MVLEGVIPSVNWGQFLFYAQLALIVLAFVAFLIGTIYYFSWRIRGIIIRRRAGGVLKGVKTWGKYTRREAGKLSQIKLLKRKGFERRPPQTALVAFGRKDFIMWLEDDAGDLKPFRVHIERAVVRKAIQSAIKRVKSKQEIKTEGDQEKYLINLLLNYFCPSLSVDDVDMRFWKVQQDKATEATYKKVEKWKDVLYIGGFVIMVVMFVVGMVLMKSVCN